MIVILKSVRPGRKVIDARTSRQWLGQVNIQDDYVGCEFCYLVAGDLSVGSGGQYFNVAIPTKVFGQGLSYDCRVVDDENFNFLF